jgi:hypothetical protein
MLTEAEVKAIIGRLRDIAGRVEDAFDEEALLEAAQEMTTLAHDRDMYQARCLAAAKQCDEMTLALAGLQARRQKANDK